MSKCLKDLSSRSSFTLIELLVVVAIIAILSVFVIITINPAELLKQGRDSQRVSDIATINSALNLYQVDQVTGSLGTASTTYISIPDNTATSTTGTQCQGLSLPALPSGWTYHCPASSTYRNTDGTGWIPVNFSSISYGSPLGSLPVDPTNTSSSGYYYTYTPGGSWQLTATPESGKIRTTQANQTTGAITQGSNLSLSPLFSSNGLVGYWKFDEGSGTSTTDSSSNNNIGSLINGPAWTTGKVGSAIQFSNGNYVTIPNSSSIAITGNMTITAWIKVTDFSNSNGIVAKSSSIYPAPYDFHLNPTSGIPSFWRGSGASYYANANGISAPALNQWQFISVTMSGTTVVHYLNGIFNGSSTLSTTIGDAGNAMYIASRVDGGTQMKGDMDDIRIYNRALSAAEIMALYNATK